MTTENLDIADIGPALTEILEECVGELTLTGTVQTCMRAANSPAVIYVTVKGKDDSRVLARGLHPHYLAEPREGDAVRVTGRFVFYPPKGAIQFHFTSLDIL